MPEVTEEMLPPFVRESNYIEGIHKTTNAHIAAHRAFLSGPVTIPALVALVKVLQPDARFRNEATVSGVRVGDHIAPPSGPEIERELRSIIAIRDPWEQHVAYETLHPFTDGNGRSGRAIWLHRHWHDSNTDQWAIRRGFLHSFYYHTLSGVRRALDPAVAAPSGDVERVAAILKRQRANRYADEAVAGNDALVDLENAREIIAALSAQPPSSNAEHDASR